MNPARRAKNETASAMAAGTLTGRGVLICLLGFFAVTFTADGFLVHYALSTFSGIDADNSYQNGIAFQRQVAAAKAQNERGWKVDIAVIALPDGSNRFDIAVNDAQGQPIPGLTAVLRLNHIAAARLDQAVPAADLGGGRFTAVAKAAPGQWELALTLEKSGERLFLSRSRILLKGPENG